MTKRRRPKVYIPNKSGHLFDGAERFGELIFCTKGHIDRTEAIMLYQAFVRSMEGSRRSDYFLPCSLSVANAIGGAVFARKHGTLRLLVLEGNEYILRELDIDSLIEDQEAAQ